MGAFDECIIEFGARLDAIRKTAPSVVDARVSGDPASWISDLPVQYGPGANPGVILRSDTFVELGNPADGSCAAVLWTDHPALVVDGNITLLGPDIPEASGNSLPFAQVIVAGGPDLSNQDHEALTAAQNVADRLEGFMAKSTSDYVWARISHEGAAKGLTLETLGRVLLHQVKTAVPRATSAEVFLVTSSRGDVRSLAEVAASARQIGSEILKETWKERGFDLDCDFDCESCTDQEVCDDIREVIVETAKVAVAKKKSLRERISQR